MKTFNAILRADKSWSYIIDENGIKFLMQKGRTFNLVFAEKTVKASLQDWACVGTMEKTFTWFVKITLEETPATSEFNLLNEDSHQAGFGCLVTNSDEFEQAKKLLEDRIEYIRNELDELVEKCANGEVKKETVDAERGLLKRLEIMYSSFLESEEEFEI